MSSQHPNRVLAGLPQADFEMVRVHLKPFPLLQGDFLFDAGEPINWAYFPHDGIISLVVGLSDGQLVEAAMVGCDSQLGGWAAMATGLWLTRGLVQVDGTCSLLDVETLRVLADKSQALRAQLARHEQALLAQAQQSAACNAAHSVQARLARCLLRTRDLVGADTFDLTQDFLVQMLGVRRTRISLVAHKLQEMGAIRYRRGHVEIVDLEKLRQTACECYDIAKVHTDRLLGAVGV